MIIDLEFPIPSANPFMLRMYAFQKNKLTRPFLLILGKYMYAPLELDIFTFNATACLPGNRNENLRKSPQYHENLKT